MLLNNAASCDGRDSFLTINWKEAEVSWWFAREKERKEAAYIHVGSSTAAASFSIYSFSIWTAFTTKQQWATDCRGSLFVMKKWKMQTWQRITETSCNCVFLQQMTAVGQWSHRFHSLLYEMQLVHEEMCSEISHNFY